MTTPTNGASRAAAHHTVTIINRHDITITAPVVYVKDLGNGKAEVHVETAYHIEAGHAHPATYDTPSHTAKGHYMVHGSTWTHDQTYIYRGIFTRSQYKQGTS